MMQEEDEMPSSRFLFPAIEADELELEVSRVQSPSMFSTQQQQQAGKKQTIENTISPAAVDSHPSISIWDEAPIVRVSENGTEVILGSYFRDLNLSTPKKSQAPPRKQRTRSSALLEVRSNSLMDIDKTPSPCIKSSMKNISLCCDPTKRCWQDEDVCQVTQSQQDIEQCLSKFLEDPQIGSGCSGWQAWSYFGVLNAEEQQSGDIKNDIRTSLRNRTCNVRARKSRVKRLRKDLSPFKNSPARPSGRQLFQSQSFSIEDHAPAIARVSRDNPRRAMDAFNIFQSCTSPQNVASPVMIRHVEEHEICYDSDPEDFARRRSHHWTAEQDKENTRKQDTYSYPKQVSTAPTGTIADISNDKAFRAVIQEFMNETTTLKFHPSMTDTCLTQPLAVHAWVERGQRLQTILQPKFMWRSVHLKKSKGNSIENPTISGIDLLDITRILKVKKIDRRRYPFAKPMHCFIIKTIQDEDLCFEAKSVLDRNRLVYSFKMIVARFGAKVIVADESLFDEFFAIQDGGVPGEAPEWTNSERTPPRRDGSWDSEC
jgi:hypothetical protein